MDYPATKRVCRSEFSNGVFFIRTPSQPLPVDEAVREGHKPSYNQLHRFERMGMGGIKLRTVG